MQEEQFAPPIGRGSGFMRLGRARGFWHGAVTSFLNNETGGVFGGGSKEDKGFQEGQFDNDLEGENEPSADQENITKDEKNLEDCDVPDFCDKVEEQEVNFRKSVKSGYDPKASQEKRREKLLNGQKQRRDAILDKIRQLETSSDSEFEEDEDFVNLVKENKLQKISEENEEMDTAGVPRENKPRRRYKRPNKNRNSPCRVMLSEWLVDKPTDFYENWMGVFCPVGKRCLVVASRGKTCVFSRTHEYMGVFQSCLPGGSKLNSKDPEIKKKKGVTILDCIWSMEAEVFYVLDLVCWASQSYNNCDKAYRQFFQTSKLSETPGLMESSFSNPYPFLSLPSFDCSDIAEVMMSSLPSFSQKVDGVLFFHKESFYMNGVNPLCLWIYLTEMETKIQVSVAPELAELQRMKRPRQEESNDEKTKPMEVQT